MKKWIAVCFCLLSILLLAACGADRDESYPEKYPDYVEGELMGETLAEIVAKNLGVPESPGITWEIGQRYYWEYFGVSKPLAVLEDRGSARVSANRQGSPSH